MLINCWQFKQNKSVSWIQLYYAVRALKVLLLHKVYFLSFTVLIKKYGNRKKWNEKSGPYLMILVLSFKASVPFRYFSVLVSIIGEPAWRQGLEWTHVNTATVNDYTCFALPQRRRGANSVIFYQRAGIENVSCCSSTHDTYQRHCSGQWSRYLHQSHFCNILTFFL